MSLASPLAQLFDHELSINCCEIQINSQLHGASDSDGIFQSFFTPTPAVRHPLEPVCIPDAVNAVPFWE